MNIKEKVLKAWLSGESVIVYWDFSGEKKESPGVISRMNTHNGGAIRAVDKKGKGIDIGYERITDICFVGKVQTIL